MGDQYYKRRVLKNALLSLAKCRYGILYKIHHIYIFYSKKKMLMTYTSVDSIKRELYFPTLGHSIYRTKSGYLEWWTHYIDVIDKSLLHYENAFRGHGSNTHLHTLRSRNVSVLYCSPWEPGVLLGLQRKPYPVFMIYLIQTGSELVSIDHYQSLESWALLKTCKMIFLQLRQRIYIANKGDTCSANR